ncbi:MAG: LamG-like jellyroll fold domain-containing protein, partial [Mariprofundales bacterium]
SSIAAGFYHTVALKSDGSLWTWGYNNFGQLGDGTTVNSLVPKQIGTGFSSIAAGLYHTVALKSDGSLWTWGRNNRGQLGDGTTVNSLTPKQIGTGFSSIAAGYYHTVALKSNGSLWTWGYNLYGQLGDGTTVNSLVPKQIGTGFSSIAAGFYHTVALKSDGSLWTWGRNNRGQLGDGTTVNSLVPKQIGTGFSSIAAGFYHTVALKSDGSLWTWGYNTNGQLGDGTTVNSLIPKQIAAGNGLLLDADGDGLNDFNEVMIHGTNPLLVDTDGDGLSDFDEVRVLGTNPILADTDSDGFSDFAEINTYATNPLDAGSYPNIAPVAGLNQGGGALQFDGVNDYVYLGAASANNLQFAGTSPFSIEAWVRPDIVNARGTILSKFNGGVAGEYSLSITSLGKVEFHREAFPWALKSTASLTAGTFSHIAATYDGINIRIYINGVLDSTKNGGSIIARTTPVLIGADYTNNAISNFFNGQLDDVRIWNTARTQVQIQTDMYSSLLGNEIGLVGYWNFDAAVDVYANDLSATGNNGLLGGGIAANTPLWTNAPAFVLNNPATVTMLADSYATLWLSATDANSDPLSLTITVLPAAGTLYQTADGINLGTAITVPSTVVSDTYSRVIFVPAAGQTGMPYANFDFIASDPYTTSPTAVVGIDVL